MSKVNYTNCSLNFRSHNVCTGNITVELICNPLLMLINYPKTQKYLQMEDVKSMTHHKKVCYLSVFCLFVPPGSTLNCSDIVGRMVNFHFSFAGMCEITIAKRTGRDSI